MTLRKRWVSELSEKLSVNIIFLDIDENKYIDKVATHD